MLSAIQWQRVRTELAVKSLFVKDFTLLTRRFDNGSGSVLSDYSVWRTPLSLRLLRWPGCRGRGRSTGECRMNRFAGTPSGVLAWGDEVVLNWAVTLLLLVVFSADGEGLRSTEVLKIFHDGIGNVLLGAEGVGFDGMLVNLAIFGFLQV